MIEHKHLIVKGSIDKSLSVIQVEQFLLDLVDVLDMELMKGVPTNPNVGYEGGKDSGVTGCALITTSHLVLHTWDKSLDFQLDVYSCKNYSPKDVENLCNKFGLKIDDKRFFDRKYNIIDENI
tara:strand:+ start:1829 stop:2197 length:369 start_codon:yes stop_codon:yes gene_type:complete